MAVTGGASQGVDAESFCSFVFGRSAPDAIWLGGFQRVREPRVDDGAGSADSLRVVDAGLPCVASFVRRVENMELAIASAGGVELPIPVAQLRPG